MYRIECFVVLCHASGSNGGRKVEVEEMATGLMTLREEDWEDVFLVLILRKVPTSKKFVATAIPVAIIL
jgi:hypothetical protein